MLSKIERMHYYVVKLQHSSYYAVVKTLVNAYSIIILPLLLWYIIYYTGLIAQRTLAKLFSPISH